MEERPETSSAIIAVAPNGARRTKADHPATPLRADEIAEDAAACCDAGATLIHLHVRDDEGHHSLDPQIYRAATDAIRTKLDKRMLVQVSTELAGVYDTADQMSLVEALDPDAASIALRELMPDASAEANAARFLERVCARKTAVQYILYSPDDVRRYERLCREELIPRSPQLPLLVLGRHAEGGAHVGELASFVEALPERTPHMVCAFGSEEPKIMQEVLRVGGHCRVGFENNLCLRDGSTAPDNAAVVAATVSLAHAIGRTVADAGETRSLLGIRNTG